MRARRPYRRRMPPRPHPIVLASLAAACAFVALLLAPRGAWGAGPATRAAAARPQPTAAAWRWPLPGAVVGAFRLTPRTPFARGQRRGVDIAGAPGAVVRAACAGRVTFAGALPRGDLAVTVRCGPLAATYLGLGRLTVRRAARVVMGTQLGTVGPRGVVRLGARRAADRRGYLDPLTLLRGDGRMPPALGPAPRPRRRSRPRHPRPPALAPAAAPAPRPDAPPHHLPWPAYPALALVASALPVGGLVRRRRRPARPGADAAATVAVAPTAGTPSARR